MKYSQNWSASLLSKDGKETLCTFPASVPGNVQYDLAVYEGIDESLMFSVNARRFLALEDHFWKYETTLDFESDAGESVFFVSEGIDYRFDIFLDGEKLLEHEGMFSPISLDLTGKAGCGSVLAVLIYPHPKREGEFAEPRGEASASCKPPACYEWDWNPRLLVSGLFRPCYIETRGKGFIRSSEAFYELNADFTEAKVHFETDCDEAVRYEIKDPDGKIVYEGETPDCAIESPCLWWCNGQGKPNLYTWTARSVDHSRSGRIGFRTLRLVRNEGAGEVETSFPKSRYPAPMTIELNGRCIFAMGSNWVAPDLFPGRVDKDRLNVLLDAAKDANMNILRIWGGSGINPDAFYDLCDEKGIMVWQEFMLACNNYNAGAPYLRILEQEASAIIVHLRSHACLALWCGGNELFNGWSGMDDQSHPLRLLNKLCYELDFARPFLPTSPIYGTKHGGYLFDDGKQTAMSSFVHAHGTAYCEFGVSSIAALEDLIAIIPEEERFPIKKTDAWVYHHAFGAWGETRWLCLEMLEKYFGTFDSLKAVVYASNLIQCAGYKAIFEEARRQWPYCSMAINWCFNEPWITAANNSLLTYPAKKKPAYFAVRDSLRPALPSARIPKIDWHSGERFEIELWYLNSAVEDMTDRVSVLLSCGNAWQMELGSFDASVKAGKNTLLGTLSAVLPEAMPGELTLTLRSEQGNDSVYTLLLRT